MERYVVDPDDPRAPPEHVWARMSPEERRRVVESLPSEFELSEAAPPPEGESHLEAKLRAREALKSYFARSGKRIYVGCELPVYYPGQAMFAPDILAVVDTPLHKRDSWIVTAEGRGLDLVLEVIWSGRRRKDLEKNVERYASLGIPEYFVFDRKRMRLSGYRLPDTAKKPAAYQPILAQSGRYASRVLGLDLFLEHDRLRFYDSTAALPDAEELVARLEGMMDSVEARVHAAEERAEEEARRAEEEARRADDEARARKEAERLLAEALAEIERLKRGS